MKPLSLVLPGRARILLDSAALLTGHAPERIVQDALEGYIRALPAPDRAAVDELTLRAMMRAETLSGTNESKATIRFPRLCFKRNVIEPLAFEDTFQIVTDTGTFQMTKAEFYTDFANVVGSRSYQEAGIYHYPKLPSKAEKYRVG